jgi:hypothetical protein
VPTSGLFLKAGRLLLYPKEAGQARTSPINVVPSQMKNVAKGQVTAK